MENKKGLRIAAAVLTLFVSINMIFYAAVIYLPAEHKLAQTYNAAGDDRYFSHSGRGEIQLVLACVTQLLPIIFSIILLRRGKKGIAVALLVVTSICLAGRLYGSIVSINRFYTAKYIYDAVAILLHTAVIVMLAVYLSANSKKKAQLSDA